MANTITATQSNSNAVQTSSGASGSTFYVGSLQPYFAPGQIPPLPYVPVPAVAPNDGQLIAWSQTAGAYVAVNPTGAAQLAAASNGSNTPVSMSASSGAGAAVDLTGCVIVVPSSNGRPVTIAFSALIGQTAAGAGSIYLELVNVTAGNSAVGLVIEPLPNSTASAQYLVTVSGEFEVGAVTAPTTYKLSALLYSPSGSSPSANVMNLPTAPSRIHAVAG